MFKLLALRVLDGCADYIQKCLKTDVYYYFCTDYRFEYRDKVCRGSRYSEPLHSAFFTPVPNNQFGEKQSSPLTINVNAIVGKNGDGKSTIVELIIRLVNNYISKHLDSQHAPGIQPLLYVNGLHAELYFQLDDYIYRLFSTSTSEGLYQIANISAFLKDPTIQSIQCTVNKTPENVVENIYTLVSNYSHYAYNMFDFKSEWVYKGNNLFAEDVQNKIFWMHRIFHKNDGYITPLSIHPYRISGNIDVNREAQLSKQRLLYLFVKSTDESNAFRNILGKKAIGIRLTPSATNKLYERTIKAFFLAHNEEDNSWDWATNRIKKETIVIFEKINAKDIESQDYTSILPNLENLYDNEFKEVIDIFDIIFTGSNFPYQTREVYVRFLTKTLNKLEIKTPRLSSTRKLVNSVHSLFKRIRDTYSRTLYAEIKEYHPHFMARKYEKCIPYNICQIARLHTIFCLTLHYNINPEILLKEYDELTNKERAQLYKIYKTISIFETYPKYIEIISEQKGKYWGIEACLEYTDSQLNELYALLKNDIESGSHITRKLVQTDNYLYQPTDIFTDEPDLQITYNKLDKQSKIKDISCVEHYYGEQNVDIFHLIPPVFEYDIVLRDGDSYMELGTLSSGEKQLLNNIGAIIYHLQNIDAATIIYKTVNLILEEIELYFHPEYQRLFINRLLDQIYGLGLKNIQNINITFVTHSPFVLSDVPKSNVLFLKDGKPDYEMQENTFGANIHSLLKNGFFLPNLPMGEFAYQKINELFRKLNDHQYGESEIPQIKQEISVIGEPYLREQLYKLLRIAQPA